MTKLTEIVNLKSAVVGAAVLTTVSFATLPAKAFKIKADNLPDKNGSVLNTDATVSSSGGEETVFSNAIEEVVITDNQFSSNTIINKTNNEAAFLNKGFDAFDINNETADATLTWLPEFDLMEFIWFMLKFFENGTLAVLNRSSTPYTPHPFYNISAKQNSVRSQ